MSVITQRQLLKSAIVASTACLSLGCFSPSAMAITVFDFGNSSQFTSSDGGLTYTAFDEPSGITATLSDYRDNNSPFLIDQSVSTAYGVLIGESLGLFGQQGIPFTLTLSALSGNPVRILQFTTRSSNSPDLSLVFTPSSGGTSLNSNFSPTPGTYNLTSPIVVGSSDTIFTTSDPDKQDVENPDLTPESYLAGITVQEVPWETDVLPLVGATILFGGGVWWKRRRAAASQLDLTGQGLEQESGRE